MTLTFNKADLENIKTFYDFSSNPIVDITGLDKFTGLESLKLNANYCIGVEDPLATADFYYSCVRILNRFIPPGFPAINEIFFDA